MSHKFMFCVRCKCRHYTELILSYVCFNAANEITSFGNRYRCLCLMRLKLITVISLFYACYFRFQTFLANPHHHSVMLLTSTCLVNRYPKIVLCTAHRHTVSNKPDQQKGWMSKLILDAMQESWLAYTIPNIPHIL